MPPEGLWIPITIWAGFAQTLRNAAQRHLVESVGTLGATLVRFLFGLPFALAWLVIVLIVGGDTLPSPNVEFVAWVIEGGVAQIVATALLLRVMASRNFAIGVAYSKTELIQVAVFGAVFLTDPTSLSTVVAIFLATMGVMLMSPLGPDRSWRSLVRGWTTQTAMLGVASGGCFALAAVGYRGAALALDDTPFTLAAAYALVWAQSAQVVVLGGWLLYANPAAVVGVFRAWPVSTAAGFMGAAASAGWFTAMAIEPVAHVRTLGLVELLFSLAVARRLFSERLNRLELIGVALLTLALILIVLNP
jgi:drug/metabolite transporter (DMT)-like permease